MLKKISIFFLAFCVVMSSIPFAFAAESPMVVSISPTDGSINVFIRNRL